MAEVAISDQLADEVLAELGGPSPLWRWLGTPALLGGVLLALYLYVQGQELDRIGLPATAIVEPGATLQDALDTMLTSRVGCTIVVDRAGAYLGVVDISTIMNAIQDMRTATRARDRASAAEGGDEEGSAVANG